jgi:hypothetical protein
LQWEVNEQILDGATIYAKQGGDRASVHNAPGRSAFCDFRCHILSLEIRGDGRSSGGEIALITQDQPARI